MNIPQLPADMLDDLVRRALETGKATHLLQDGTSTDHPGVMAIALQPGTYIQPHAHPHASETFLHVQGSMKVFSLHGNGAVYRASLIGPADQRLTIPRGTLHTVVALERNSVAQTIYHGNAQLEPYRTTPEWALPEDAPSGKIEHYVRGLLQK